MSCTKKDKRTVHSIYFQKLFHVVRISIILETELRFYERSEKNCLSRKS